MISINHYKLNRILYICKGIENQSYSSYSSYSTTKKSNLKSTTNYIKYQTAATKNKGNNNHIRQFDHINPYNPTKQSTAKQQETKTLDQGYNWENVTFHRTLTPEKLQQIQDERQDLIEYNRKKEKIAKIDENLASEKKFDYLMENKKKLQESGELDEGIDNQDPTKFEFGKMKTKTFVQEKFQIIPLDKRGDDDFIRKELQSNEFESNLKEEDGWREYDIEKGDYTKERDADEEENKSLAKLGLQRRSNGMYCEDYKIEAKYMKYFTDPSHVTGKGRRGGMTRQEKKKIKDKDSIDTSAIESKKENKLSKRKTLYDQENMEVHTVLQKRMADRVLNILNDSFLFRDRTKSIHNSIAQGNKTQFGFFKNHKEDFVDEDELFDPVLSKVNINLTRIKVSSDLRWLKIFWAREGRLDHQDDRQDDDEEGEEEGEEQNNILDQEDDEEYELEDIEEEKNENDDQGEEYDEIEDKQELKLNKRNVKEEEEEGGELPRIIGGLKTLKAKRWLIKRLEDTLPMEPILSKATTNNENIVIHTKQRDISTTNSSTETNQLFSFGDFSNKIGADVVEFKVQIPSLDQRLDVVTPVVGNDEDVKAAKDRRIRHYEQITDEQIQDRLIKVTPRLRSFITKHLKTRYVPNLFFVLDKDQKKRDASIDIYQTIIAPEILEAAKQSRKIESIKSNEFQSQFMGVFNNNESNEDGNNPKFTIPGADQDIYMDKEFADEIIRSEFRSYYDPMMDEDIFDFEKKKIKSTKPTIQEEPKQLEQPKQQELTKEEENLNKQFFKDFNKGLFK